MSNATAAKSLAYGTTQITPSTCIGIALEADGSFLALTLSASRTFATVRGAAQWLATRGYGPTGLRLAAAL